MEILNQAQRQAVEAGDVSVLIVAGPGTGKTKTLTMRIAHLMINRQVQPQAIVALTFTNRAAREMRERLQTLLGKNVMLPTITTFHALGAEFLRRSGKHRRLLSEAERQAILLSLPRPQQAKRIGVRELGMRISRAKSSVRLETDDVTRELLTTYAGVLEAQNVWDFDDLLRSAYELQCSGQTSTYEYVLVDEFQDTSELQYEMLKLLAPTGTIFAIGDPNQSIYAFRGAGAEMFAYFTRDYPEACTVALTKNYRSCPEIVHLSNALFPHSPQLVPTVHNAGAVRVIRTLHEHSEAAYILSEVEAGIGGSDMLKATGDQHVRQPREFAVLYRTHRVARALQQAFSEAGIPYQIAGEGSPYEQPDIQTIIAGLQYIHDPSNALLPGRPGLRERQIRTFLDGISVSDDMTVSDVVATLAMMFGIATTDVVRQLQSMLVQFGSGPRSLSAALSHLEDIRTNEFYDPSVNAVTLLTIHAAKGLEFGHVFLVGAEEGILPKVSKKGDVTIDEERRLFYVASTRAKDTLTITYTKIRAGKSATISRFIGDIPLVLLPRMDDLNLGAIEKRYQKRLARRAQGSLF